MVEAAILLAGGASRRMGRDKAWLEVAGRPLGALLLERLSEVYGEVVVVTNHPERFPVPTARMVGDRHPGHGPLEGLASGLEAIASESALLVAVDMPFVDRSLLEALARVDLAECDAAVPRSARGAEPLLAVYHRRLLPLARRLLSQGERRLQALLDRARPHWLVAEQLPGGQGVRAPWTNLNEPADLEVLGGP